MKYSKNILSIALCVFMLAVCLLPVFSKNAAEPEEPATKAAEEEEPVTTAEPPPVEEESTTSPAPPQSDDDLGQWDGIWNKDDGAISIYIMNNASNLYVFDKELKYGYHISVTPEEIYYNNIYTRMIDLASGEIAEHHFVFDGETFEYKHYFGPESMEIYDSGVYARVPGDVLEEYTRVLGEAVEPATVEEPVEEPDEIPELAPLDDGTLSSWATDLVKAAIELNLVPYELQSNYTQATTRAEFAALAVTLYEKLGGAIDGVVEFDDTDDINVQKAAAAGIVAGVGNNRFDPDAELTREQAAVMLSRLAESIGTPFPAEAATFDDNDNISEWAVEGVGQVQAAGVMSGTGNNMFSPKDPYTREQSIMTIMRSFTFLADGA